ncbi:hypothetical protein M758_10G140800 [Ceratodon purpureus]|nr:hypothetical protein M758_10G140800 [Ceratodon purpureus]
MCFNFHSAQMILQKYVPVLMAMAKIWWDKEDYAQVERIFQQSTDLCSEHNLWKLNVAHTFFMQENKYKEAIHYYEPIVKEVGDNVLTVTAIVLANLCVSYIMTSRNEDAEDLMRKIEKEEERAHYDLVCAGCLETKSASLYSEPGDRDLVLCKTKL